MVCLGQGAPAVTDAVFYFTVVWCVVDVLVLFHVILTNSLVVVSVLYYRIRHKRGSFSKTSTCLTPLEDPVPVASDLSLRLVINLAVADVMFALVTLYSFTFYYSCGVAHTLGRSRTACVLRYALVLFTVTASGYSVAAVAVERYVAIVYALRYHEIMTSRNVSIMISVVWVFSLSAGTAVVVWNDWHIDGACNEKDVLPFYFIVFTVFVDHVIICVVVVLVHLRIHLAAVASNKRRYSIDFGGASRATSGINTKSARLLITISLCYIALWAPLMATLIVMTSGVGGSAAEITFHVTYTIANLNFVLNPILYAWKNKNVRHSVIKIFENCKRHRKDMSIRKCGKVNNISSMLHMYP